MPSAALVWRLDLCVLFPGVFDLGPVGPFAHHGGLFSAPQIFEFPPTTQNRLLTDPIKAFAILESYQEDSTMELAVRAWRWTC